MILDFFNLTNENMSLRIFPFLITTLILSSTLATAQTEKGRFLVGGSIGFNSTKIDYDQGADFESFGYGIRPIISYFIIDELAIGVSVPYSYNKSTSNNQESISNTISFGPSLRYYFPFGKSAIFPTVSYSFGKSTRKGPAFDPLSGSVQERVVESNINTLNIGAGYTYFLNKNIGLEAIISYLNRNIDYESNIFNGSEESSFNFNIGFQIYL